jgi:hypothetical protein
MGGAFNSFLCAQEASENARIKNNKLNFDVTADITGFT